MDYSQSAREFARFGESLQKEVRNESRKTPINLPVVAYLGTGRIWYQWRHTSVVKEKKLDDSFFSRTWAFRDCISASSKYKQFEDWYGWIYQSYWEKHIANREKGLAPNSAAAHFSDAIEAVQKAVNEITKNETGWRDIAYSASLGRQIALKHSEYGEMPLSMLSDGLRNAVALAADLAFRCIKLNPHYGSEAALITEGIAMIDEADRPSCRSIGRFRFPERSRSP